MDYTRMVVDYLNGKALGVSAYREVPNVRPDSFMVVELTGGPAQNSVQRTPSFDVDCWAKTAHDAEELASDVMAALIVMPAEVENVFHASISTSYNNPDPDSGTPRYTVGCDIEANE